MDEKEICFHLFNYMIIFYRYNTNILIWKEVIKRQGIVGTLVLLSIIAIKYIRWEMKMYLIADVLEI